MPIPNDPLTERLNMSEKKTLAWHFLYEGHKLRDGRDAPADGVWLEHTGPIVICESGLHASRRPADALSHAPGPILCLVECDGIVSEHADKLVCRRRKIIARMDATDMLRYYARMQALSVVHLWSPPGVVLDYLMTGDESIRAAAGPAAGAAARGDFDALVHECFSDYLEPGDA